MPIKELIKKVIGFPKNTLFRTHFLKKYDCLLIQTPSHTNIGDSQIALAERSFLKEYNINFFEVTFDEYWSNRSFLIRKKHKFDFLVIHGGGNIGDEYLNEEMTRRDILKAFDDKRIIIFPQTIHFTNTDTGNAESLKTVELYNSIPKLSIFLRDKRSYDYAIERFTCSCYYVPDIVLSVSKPNLKCVKNGKVLFVLRNDNEKVTDNSKINSLKIILKNAGIDYDDTDMMAEKVISKNHRENVCNNKIQQIAGYSLVITDRLHGMVFSYLANTSCIALDNYNGKVSGTYEWIKNVESINYSNNVDDIKIELVKKLITTPFSVNIVDKSLFNPLIEVLKNHKKE